MASATSTTQSLVRGKATICVVNYKTPELIKLCLRSIRAFTRYPHEVVVVDNDSRDESLDYLRSLTWIRLAERTFGEEKLLGNLAEGSAYDIALKQCETEFFMTMHSDTIVKKSNWLTELLEHFGDNENIASVGSGKLELIPRWRVLLKKATDFKALQRRLFYNPRRLDEYRYHNRTICCGYRTDILQRENLSFLMGKERGCTAGQGLYLELLARDYKTVELPVALMSRYVIHVNHATMVLNPGEFRLEDRTVRKYRRRAREAMSSETMQRLGRDTSLDR
jgi:glycosyltransferase involved in cell wall biosynthesis